MNSLTIPQNAQTRIGTTGAAPMPPATIPSIMNRLSSMREVVNDLEGIATAFSGAVPAQEFAATGGNGLIAALDDEISVLFSRLIDVRDRLNRPLG